jgi:phage-related tail protein
MVQQPVYVFDAYQMVMMRHTPPINRSMEKIMQLKSIIVAGLIMAVLPLSAISAPQQGRGENPACSGLRSRLSNSRSQISSITRDLRSAQQSVSRYESDFRQAQLRASRAKTDSERRSAESAMESAQNWIRHHGNSVENYTRQLDSAERDVGRIQDDMSRYGCR